jgi:methyl-accepting chemotaxis protein
MTQQNAAMVEQSTAAARSLAGEAEELSNLVSRFRTGAEGAPPVRNAAPQRSAPTRKAASMPAVRGNLALKATEDDWNEF